jgi:hypothetical protein
LRFIALADLGYSCKKVVPQQLRKQISVLLLQLFQAGSSVLESLVGLEGCAVQ